MLLRGPSALETLTKSSKFGASLGNSVVSVLVACAVGGMVAGPAADIDT